MQFVISRDQLLNALQTTTGVVERRQSLPVLANVLLKADAQGLSMIGSDMEIELTRHVALESLEEVGETTVAGRKLLDICRSLPESVPINVALQENKLTLQAGKSRFQLSTLPAADFPRMVSEQEMSKIILPEGQLVELLCAVHFAMAQQDVRYYLNGMLFEFSASHFTVVATDGHRLALRRSPLTQAGQAVQFIMPRKGVVELIRLLNKDSDKPVQLSYGSNTLRLEIDTLDLVSRLIDGRFPDYHRVIPENGDKIVLVERDAFRQLLQRVAVLTNEKYNAVRLHFQTGLIGVMVSNIDQEEAQDEGPSVEIGFNVHYLLDVLNILPPGNVQITLSTPEASVLLTSPTLDGACYVIMPMSL